MFGQKFTTADYRIQALFNGQHKFSRLGTFLSREFYFPIS
jgi:hypothetical protein